MAISASNLFDGFELLVLNLRILALRFMECHGVGCAASGTLCAFQILLSEKPCEQVATDHDNDADNYVE
jgi:hypothetical protein